MLELYRIEHHSVTIFQSTGDNVYIGRLVFLVSMGKTFIAILSLLFVVSITLGSIHTNEPKPGEDVEIFVNVRNIHGNDIERGNVRVIIPELGQMLVQPFSSLKNGAVRTTVLYAERPADAEVGVPYDAIVWAQTDKDKSARKVIPIYFE